MTVRRHLKLSVMAGAVGLMTTPALAQQGAQPADGLPEVEVIQQKKAAPAAKKKAPAPQASPAPQPPPAAAPAPVYADESPALDNSPYGASASGGAAARAATGSLSPVNARQTLPDDLQNYTGAGTRVTSEDLVEQQPLNNHDILTRVPGVMVVSDDGMARHSGIGVRGSPMRRSRKVLVMEDGLPINFSTYLDPSTHYTPPTERIESVEVMRGPVVNYGPLNNHGVINFRNLSPFGENETVIKAAIGHTSDVKKDINNFRHVHTRQNIGAAGVVVSYSGGDGAGSWDNEELGYNDFYGALGLRGSRQDLTISGGYFRQRDQYDEINFIPEGDPDVVGAAGGYAQFRANGRNKLGTGAFNNHAGNDPTESPNQRFANLSSYNADYWRIQATHNLYIDDDTTLTTRAYYSDNERNRMYFRRDRPAGFAMRGRERHYEFYGAESRVEFANRPFLFGMTQDIQAGIRYERHTFHNCNTVGDFNQVLDDDTNGICLFPGGNAGTHPDTGDNSRLMDIDSNAFSAFVQTAIHVTKNFTVTPGLRFENYKIDYFGQNQEDAELEGNMSSDHDVVLPMVGAAWEVAPRTTVYGGYHQGITPQVTRGPVMPLPDEKGDNFQLGVRSTAIRGFQFDLAYFHSNIENYQVKSPSVDLAGNNLFGAVDEVEIDGFEIAARFDSRAWTGGAWNFFAETIYTYADSRIEKGINDDGDDISGNRVPEVPKHFANLTFGVAYKQLWDASMTWTYRGGFFTDVDNGELDWEEGEEVEAGFVEDVWLLSARTNFHVSDNLSLFVSGTNLLNEFYLSDIDEGMKPGAARTIMGGFTYKFN